jgi:hypothetical protein
MSTSSSSNKIIDSSILKKSNKNLLKSSSASIVKKSNYENYLEKISSFKHKTRNKIKNQNINICSTETEFKNTKFTTSFNNTNNNNISVNKNIANNISFRIINHSSNIYNNNKFVKTLYQRKKIGEIIKVNKNSNSKKNNISSNEKIFNSQKLNKYSKKNFNNKVKEIGKTKLLKLKQIGMTVNSVRHSIKLNKEKQKENLEFENELYKNIKTENEINKKSFRCLSSKVINKKENIYLNHLNISSSNSVNDINKEKKENNDLSYNNNCITTVQNELLSERDLEGPEIIHFSLVELIQKGNKKMNALANQFNN